MLDKGTYHQKEKIECLKKTLPENKNCEELKEYRKIYTIRKNKIRSINKKEKIKIVERIL
jgi:predicted nucleic acid binding AN1-type Zn finger protein